MNARRLPLAALALATAGLALVAALGVTWQRNRNADWERPRWEVDRFERIAGESTPGRALHVVAFHPRCPHCLVSLEHAVAQRRNDGGDYRLAVLIVDTPERPDLATLPRRGEDEVWWDRAGRWRHRWGHRIYGEVLRFDEAGEHLETLHPAAVTGTE